MPKFLFYSASAIIKRNETKRRWRWWWERRKKCWKNQNRNGIYDCMKWIARQWRTLAPTKSVWSGLKSTISEHFWYLWAKHKSLSCKTFTICHFMCSPSAKVTTCRFPKLKHEFLCCHNSNTFFFIFFISIFIFIYFHNIFSRFFTVSFTEIVKLLASTIHFHSSTIVRTLGNRKWNDKKL